MRFIFTKFFLFLLINLNAQNKNELEKAYTRNSAELLKAFVHKYSTNNKSHCSDTCNDISKIIQFISDQFIRLLEKGEKDNNNNIFRIVVYKDRAPSQKFLLYNSAIDVQISQFDLFKWNIEIKEFNLFSGKKIYRDSVLEVLSNKEWNLDKLQEKAYFKRPLLTHYGSIYIPSLLNSVGGKMINDFVNAGQSEKKRIFLNSVIKDVSGVAFFKEQQYYKFWGFSLFFKDIVFNKERTQAKITVVHEGSAFEYFFEKRSNEWSFVSTGAAWAITS